MEASNKFETIIDAKQWIEKFFVGNCASYSELQKILLIFKLFNLDNDLGQSILDAVEQDWLNREPESGCDDEPFLDGIMECIDLVEIVNESLAQRRSEAADKVLESLERARR